MFELASNKKIGQYLMKRIDKRFKSRRQFCKTYLEAMGEQTDNEQIRKMSNRLSQILNGKKEIQLYDLPLFCRLLEVSCEDILSAGKIHTFASARLTNYAAAFSKDKREWEAYVNRENSPILNADEYGKTFIDYALEAENYDLLKYLMDKHLIWFVGEDKKDYFVGFGAGTSIEKAIFPYHRNWNVLNAQLKMRDELRTHMIALAIQHEDMEMLEQLHAREIPFLYQVSFYASSLNTCEQYYNAELMEALAHADNKILEYFSEEFEITDGVRSSDRFLFPFIGKLMERLLQNKNGFVEYMLKDAIQHNQYVYDQLASSLTAMVRYYKKMSDDVANVAVKNDLTKSLSSSLYFSDDGSLVKYFVLLPVVEKGLCSNIIRVDAKSEDTLINRRILELNDLYDAIHHIASQFGGDAEQY